LDIFWLKDDSLEDTDTDELLNRAEEKGDGEIKK